MPSRARRVVLYGLPARPRHTWPAGLPGPGRAFARVAGQIRSGVLRSRRPSGEYSAYIEQGCVAGSQTHLSHGHHAPTLRTLRYSASIYNLDFIPYGKNSGFMVVGPDGGHYRNLAQSLDVRTAAGHVSRRFGKLAEPPPMVG
jgi:hypothetical protein